MNVSNAIMFPLKGCTQLLGLRACNALLTWGPSDLRAVAPILPVLPVSGLFALAHRKGQEGELARGAASRGIGIFLRHFHKLAATPSSQILLRYLAVVEVAGLQLLCTDASTAEVGHG